MTGPQGISRRDVLLASAAVGAGVAVGYVADGVVEWSNTDEEPRGEFEAVLYVPAGSVTDIRAALDALGTTPGQVVLGPGRVDDVTDSIVVPSNTWLRGTGRGATTLAFADAAAPELAGLLRVTGARVLVSDLALDGNRAEVPLSEGNSGREYGIYTSGAQDVTLSRVACRNFAGYGIDPHADGGRASEGVVVTDCLAENNGFDGITLAGVSGGIVRDCVSRDNDRHGLAVTDHEATGVSLVGNVSRGNGASGVVVQNRATGATIGSNVIAANDRDGVRIGSGEGPSAGVVVANNVIRDNGLYGVNVRLSTEITVTGNRVADNGYVGNVTAAVVLQDDGSRFSGDVVITGNQIRVADGVAHGVEERPGNGPTAVGLNVFQTAGDAAVRTTHEDSIAQLNI